MRLIKRWLTNWAFKSGDPFSQKKQWNIRNIAGTLTVFSIVSVIGASYIKLREDRVREEKSASFASVGDMDTRHAEGGGGSSFPPHDPAAGSFMGRDPVNRSHVVEISAVSMRRSLSANQIIPRDGNGSAPGSSLPIGFAVPVRLINAIQSGENATPVMAEVTDDVSSRDSVAIPQGTHAIGQASVDESSRRIQVHFNTLVDPEGDQHSVQGLALMPDGSAGLEGNYHSGSGTRQLGRFLGTFIGGMAQGMTEQEAGGVFGNPYEVGSIRNGLLTGISQSAQDQTKILTDDLSNAKPTISLPAGQNFILYLETRYQP